jgi:hypothetical protein
MSRTKSLTAQLFYGYIGCVSKTITCPNCKQEHGLFYVVHAKNRKTLNYICNRVVRSGMSRARVPEPQLVTAVLTADFVADLPIPEQWSPKYAKAMQDKQQDQLVLMWNKTESERNLTQ